MRTPTRRFTSTSRRTACCAISIRRSSTTTSGGGRGVHAECFGMMDIEAGKPMQLETIFRFYSMTKAITSVAVMMLYEQGHCQLYDSISNFIPEFKGSRVFVKSTKSGPELADAE